MHFKIIATPEGDIRGKGYDFTQLLMTFHDSLIRLL